MSEQQTRWAIIYCPKEGITSSHKRWEEIRSYMESKNIAYDFVQSQGKDSVERLATMMISNGYTTLVVVGGDSALNRALNGMLAVDNVQRNDIRLGVIPYGWGNDFARFWGFEENDYKKAIDWLQQGRVRKVDVGCCSFTSPTGASKRYFLNCVNVGLVSHVMNIKHKSYRFVGLRTLSFIISIFLMIFRRLETQMHFKVNENDVTTNVMTLCVGSARGYGQTPSAVPYNGLLDVSVVSHPELMQLLEGMWLLIWGRFLTHKKVKSYRTRKVKFFDTGKAPVSIDGELQPIVPSQFDITVHSEWINFIIPS